MLFNDTILNNIIYGVNNYAQEELEEVIKLSGLSTFLNDKLQCPEGFNTYVGELGKNISGG